MEQVPTTSSSEDPTTASVSSASPSIAPPTPVQPSDNNCTEKRLQSVSEYESEDETHDEADQMSEVGLFSLDKDDLWEDLNARLSSTFLVTGTDDTDAEQSIQGGLDTTHRQLEGEVAAALIWMRAENKNENRTLVEACQDGDVDAVRKLLNEGRSVHEISEKGLSLLSIACSAGYYELALLLLAMQANVEDRGIKGDCTPLMEAASSGFVEIVSLLLVYGANVNALSSIGNTPLMFACAGKEYLNREAYVKVLNENDRTTPDGAESAGHVMVVKTLLEHGADINRFNEYAESALTLACDKGHLEIVRLLLAAGAHQEHETDEGHTALMKASMEGRVEVARLLLDSGAGINKKSDGYQSPLTLAASYGHVELALLLIDRGANIEEVDMELYTPLMLAAQEGYKDMTTALLSKGANINALAEDTEETALTLACYGGFLDIAKLLVENGAMLELGSPTPLIEAAEQGHIDLVRYLLESGANVHAQNDTALVCAYKSNHQDVVNLLLAFGATLMSEH